MAMTHCKECGAEISKSAKVCPKCGKVLRHTGLRVILVIVLFMFIGIVAASGSNNDKVNTPSNSVSNNKAISTSVVTKENYEKIQNGMTEAEVQSILGEPQSVSENEISGLGKTVLKHYQEAFSLKAIDVYFNNGKVYMKNWTEL